MAIYTFSENQIMQLCHLRFTNLLNENIIYYPNFKEWYPLWGQGGGA